MADYISAAETAKLVRAALKRAFPGFTFSVRSRTYAGGASIDVRWEDGPTRKAVDAIISAYQGGRFDGSIDYAYSVWHWLMPDGAAIIADNPGSSCTGGYHEGQANPAPAPGARLVSFGAQYVSGDRDLSDAFAARVRDAFAALTSQQRFKVVAATSATVGVHSSYDLDQDLTGLSHSDRDRAFWRIAAQTDARTMHLGGLDFSADAENVAA